MTFADISPVVSLIALTVSLFTLWFTILRRGVIRITHPSFIAFRYDFVDKSLPQAKIFLRALLFSTGKRGQVIESLFLRVNEGLRQAEFSFWGHGDKDLIRGSGLFVPETGVVTNHHFNPIDSETLFFFSAGSYSIELVAKVVGQKKLISLWHAKLEMPDEIFGADKLYGTNITSETSVYYSWSPEKRCYIASFEKRLNSVNVFS